MNARPRKDARLTLDSMSKAIVTHMLKIILFPAGAVNHWQNELSGMARILSRYHAGKSGGENFTLAMFTEYLYDDYIDALPLGFVKEFEDEYGAADYYKLHDRLMAEVEKFYSRVTEVHSEF